MAKINSFAENYTEVTATLFLTKGAHFFFQCDKKVNYERTQQEINTNKTAKDSKPLQHDIFCSLDSLMAQMPLTDNVNLIIKPMSCDDLNAKRTKDATANINWFQGNCVDMKNGKDQRPIVYVNDASFYFNITKSAVFENLIFDGINAFAKIEKSIYKDGMQTFEIFRAPFWPV